MRKRRNPHFIRIMHDLGLMEGEGSGFDLIYELNSRDAKPIPIIEANYNETKVIQYSEITDKEIIPLLDYVANNYELSPKDIIALGLIAQHQKILSTELTKLLQLQETERMRSYVDRLLKMNIIITRGKKKSTEFLINPKLIDNAKLNIKTTLKTIEPYSLEALICEDLRLHPNSSITDISVRLPDVNIKDLRKFVYKMANDGKLTKNGSKTDRTYNAN